ncbi:MAG: NUDIX domain-containing protein [Candidatus Saccharimonadaceae bacterium]
MRSTARAIIIKNKKLLLLTGHGADFYWTPGGGVEGDETPIEALHREVKEELNEDIITFTEYFTYDYEDQHVSSYIVTVSGGFRVSSEITGYIWYSLGDKQKLSKGLEFVLLPKLIKDGLM